MTDGRSWRLPALVVGAGALLALLSILLALWSRTVLKDAQRAECAKRASEVVAEVRGTLDARAGEGARWLEGGPRPLEVAAVWRVAADGRVLARTPGAAAEPGVAVARPGPWEAWDAHGARRAGFSVKDGPARDGEDRVVVELDLEVVASRVVEPALRRGGDAFETALVRAAAAPRDGEDAGLGFRPRAWVALDPPLSAWSVAVGQSDPEAIKRALFLQTLLLLLVAGWLLVLLVGAVVAWARRERAASARQAERERLLARAYHELQTPLAILRAAAESVQNGALATPDELTRAAEIVGRDTERVTLAVRRLLRWLRRDLAGDDRSAPAAEVVEEAARELGPGLAARGVTLELGRRRGRRGAPGPGRARGRPRARAPRQRAEARGRGRARPRRGRAGRPRPGGGLGGGRRPARRPSDPGGRRPGPPAPRRGAVARGRTVRARRRGAGPSDGGRGLRARAEVPWRT